MFYLNLVERAVDSALEQGECILDSVGVVLALRVGSYVVNHAVIHKLDAGRLCSARDGRLFGASQRRNSCR